MTRPAVAGLVARLERVLPAGVVVQVGVEAAGHYHQPLLAAGVWPAGWQVCEVNPAHVTEQRRVAGRRRVKTDAVDLEAITELMLAGRGQAFGERDAVIVELAAWSSHRLRRVATRTATKNQLLGQLDCAFPGLTLVLPDVLGTKVGRLVADQFADPARLAALGAARFVRFASARGLQVRAPMADKLVAAAKDALPTARAVVAREVLAADLELLTDLDAQVQDAADQLARLVPLSPFAPLLTVRGWGAVRAGNYGAAVGDPGRWPGYPQLYRASGLSPMRYESAGRRRDGGISREGSVELRRALIDLGSGCGTATRPAGTTPGGCASAASEAGSSPARWHTARTRSRSRSSATSSPTIRTAGPPPTPRRPPRPTDPRALHNSGRWCHPGWTKGRTRRRGRYGAPSRVTPLLAWRPALRQLRQPERRQMTRSTNREVAYVSVGARHQPQRDHHHHHHH